MLSIFYRGFIPFEEKNIPLVIFAVIKVISSPIFIDVGPDSSGTGLLILLLAIARLNHLREK
ncbi:hypothetical protein LJR015_004206 [Peribacillus frigoritolerans]|uniref:hypothetical protein n=1 Tax=Peribacillus TaxID=2675229 RepID=UPI000BA5A921|nr:hypothetical protein [Peribacillus simplex]PAL01833.1 hypothetical protein B8W99_27820 [Peribacillus simplex]